MKKVLLIAVAALSIAPTMNAKSQMDGVLKCLWMNTDVASLQTDARQAVAIDGKFYLQNHTTQKIEIWDATGKTGELASANTTNITKDDANNIIVRLTPVFPNGATAQSVRVYSGEGYATTKDINLTGMVTGRNDFFGHVGGNVLSENGGTMYMGGTWCGNFAEVTIKNADATATQYVFNTNANANLKVSGTFSTTHQMNSYGFMPGVVTLLDPVYNVTGISSGYGNSIYQLTKDASGNWVPSGYYSLPNHNGCSGYEFFECDGNKYVVYSTGSNNMDGFSIAKVVVKESPATDDTDAANRVASKYAEMLDDDSNVMYSAANAFYGNHFNVEASADEHKVYIYQYCPKAYIAKYELDLTKYAPEPTAVNDVKETASVLGIYNIQGMRLNEMHEGVNILEMSVCDD